MLGKFRKLKFLDVNKVYLIPNIIVTCCVLHNFILTKESYIEDDMDTSQEDTALGCATTQEASTQAVTKRNDIMNLLA